MEEKEEEKKSEGIIIEEAEAQLPAPLKEAAAVEEEKKLPLIEKPAPSYKQTVPLEPSFIRFGWRLPGEFLAWKTKFEGWKLSEEALEDIVELYQQLELKAPLWVQALALPAMAYGERFAEYQAWKQAGKPGLKGKEVGSTPPRGRGGEEEK